MKYLMVIAIAILALFHFVPWTEKAAAVVGKETVHAFSGRVSDVEWIETDSCPPWCEHGCYRANAHIAKMCK